MPLRDLPRQSRQGKTYRRPETVADLGKTSIKSCQITAPITMGPICIRWGPLRDCRVSTEIRSRPQETKSQYTFPLGHRSSTVVQEGPLQRYSAPTQYLSLQRYCILFTISISDLSSLAHNLRLRRISAQDLGVRSNTGYHLLSMLFGVPYRPGSFPGQGRGSLSLVIYAIDHALQLAFP